MSAATRLERIIRPFETRDVSPGRRVTAQYAPPPANVVLTMGQNGSGKVMSGSWNQTLTKYMDVNEKEFGYGIIGQPTGPGG